MRAANDERTGIMGIGGGGAAGGGGGGGDDGSDTALIAVAVGTHALIY